MMTLLLLCLVTHSSGTQAIFTVSKISVQKHQTIIIPCLYDEKYVRNRKYVSCGGVWSFSGEVKHTRMSCEDKRAERVLAATLSSAEETDTGWYWCAVSVYGSDPYAKLYLEVTKGAARLQVSSQSVSGCEGGSVTVVCGGASLWCRMGGWCVGRDEESSGKAVVCGDGEALTVSMSELKIEDSGWFFCSDGQYQMPVHSRVTKAPYTRPVTAHYTGHATALGQDNSRLLRRVVLGALLPGLFCAAVVLIRGSIRRRRSAEAVPASEGTNPPPLPDGNGRNEEVTCENLHEKTEIKQNIQGNEENKEVTCENLYEKTENKQNMQGNEKYKQVTCDDIYENMTGNTQNIQGNVKHSKVEDLYEIMTKHPAD